MRVCLAVFLVALAGCSSRPVDEILADAVAAQDRGDTQTAIALTRDAAHRGDVGAAMTLASRGRDKRTLGDWLFNPAPTHAEARWWEARLRRDAARQIAVGDTSGHLTLGRLALNAVYDAVQFSPDSVRAARRHFDAAAALGSREAIRDRAMLVLSTDGLLAAEPYLRESAHAGFAQGAMIASMAINARPRLEQGLSNSDVIGDWSKQDVVGSIRYLRTAGFPDLAAEAEARVEGFRIQARSGDAVADSIVRALDAPGPSAAAHPSVTAAHS